MTATEMMLHAVDPVERVIRSLGIEGEHPAVSPDGLKIAYDWNGDIWVANGDGSERRNLTNSPEADEFPAWSPDGTRLVYTSGGGLFIINADGSDWTPLWRNGWAPTWSPDGTQIAYTSGEGVSNHEIWVINADGVGQRFNVTEHPEWDAHPAWSPLGDLIAFSTDRDSNRDVYAAAPTGGAAVDMTGSVVARASSPTWSPTGHAIAFQSDAGGNFEIMYYEPGSVLPVLLTDGPAQDVQPSWGGGN
jgi:TolB protein